MARHFMSWMVRTGVATAICALSVGPTAAQQRTPKKVLGTAADVRLIDTTAEEVKQSDPRPIGAPTRATRPPRDSGDLVPAAPTKSDVPPEVTVGAASSGSPEEPRKTTDGDGPGLVGQPKPAGAANHEKEPLTPIPEAQNAGPAEIETTTLKGVAPGVSTLEDVEKLWGKPKEVNKQGTTLVQLYSIDPFPRVEASFVDNKLATIVLRFAQGFPANTVAHQLDLAKIQPVLVSNELGEILGQAYPERGVLFSFEPGPGPGKASMKVTHIILEPISAEPFMLRAETNLDLRYDFCLHDLDQALKLRPKNGRAHWLKSRVLMSMGEPEEAAAAAAEAARLEPNDARYRATNAQALAQLGQIAEATAQAQKAVELSEQRPHVKARAVCLLGDVAASGARPDFKQALQHHTQALQLAGALLTSRHPAIRIAAKEVMIDAHLGAAHDIAWGKWRDKEKAVDAWLDKAMTGADDLVKNEGAGVDHRLRISARALAVYVGLRGSQDPARWAKQAIDAAEALIAATPDPSRKAQLHWDLGMALYDALQIAQMRSDTQAAIRYGESAAEHFEKSKRQSQSPVNVYLLGRLYFRLGAIYAIRDSNHRAAITWFDRAVPLLEKSAEEQVVTDLGRHGETFVSMGVSYWEAGQQETAVSLTEHGRSLMEDAAKQGKLDRAALAVPYANLASMHRQLGQPAKAQRYEEMTQRSKANLR